MDEGAPCVKMAFSTPEAAERQMNRLRSSGKVLGETAHVYWCHKCLYWHWGRSDRSDKALAYAESAHQRAVWPPRRVKAMEK